MIDFPIVEHTPGVWYPGRGCVCSSETLRAYSDDQRKDEFRYAGGLIVGESFANRGDIALCAAAPDMYEALQEIHTLLLPPYQAENIIHSQKIINRVCGSIWQMAGYPFR